METHISETQTKARSQFWVQTIHQLIGAEFSAFTPFYDQVIQLQKSQEDSFGVLDQIECDKKSHAKTLEELPDLSGENDKRTLVLLNGNLNSSHDIEGFLRKLGAKLARTSRVGVVLYNPYLSWLYRLSNFLGIRRGPIPTTFVTLASLKHMARLADFEIVRMRPVVFSPFRFLGIGSFLNVLLPSIPLIRNLSLSMVVVLRPIRKVSQQPVLSVVIPARNEKGNIEAGVLRLSQLTDPLEIVFVEGHSKDQTWEEILRVQKAHSTPKRWIQAHRQTGKGKNDAVRLGFSHAKGTLLTILDADLTMPPELLGRFFDAWKAGHADFINGSRLVYDMEGGAMRPLNFLGNVFFSKAISWVLGLPLSDTLCGTKLIEKHDYERLIRWRQRFGDFDPFGDFELLFAASELCLGNVDIPIRYLARTYGETNISRFRHGAMLLKMTLIGFFKVRLGKWV